MGGNKKPKQSERILAYMERCGSITARDAMVKLGVMRLASRIHELRSAGINIGDVYVTVPDRFGDEARVKKYFIVGGESGNGKNTDKE